MDAKLYQNILSFLAYQARTTDELKRWLIKRHIADNEIKDALHQLTEEGLLDDDRYTEQFIELSMKNRPQGRRMLALRLRKKGISSHRIDQYLAKLYPEEKEILLCHQYAEQKFYRERGKKLTQKEVMRIGRHLAAKGFGVGVVWQTIKEMGITSIREGHEENIEAELKED